MNNNPHPFPLSHSVGEGRGEGELRLQTHHRNSTPKARALRHNQTDAEIAFWNQVKDRRFHGLKFKRQHPVGIYFADFVCLEHHLIVEIDGGQHNDNPQDEVRTKYLNNSGFKVIRFWNNDILSNIEGVTHSLTLALSRNAGEGTESNNVPQ